jgi:hypothetical protein
MYEKDLSTGPSAIFDMFPQPTGIGHRSQITEGRVLRPFSYTKNSDCRQLEIGHSPTTCNCIRCYPADNKDSRRTIVQDFHLIFNIPYQLKNPELKTRILNLKFLN